jgi:Flp pilus assembly protein TadB
VSAEDDREEERQEKIEEIVNNLDRDIQRPPYNNSSNKRGYSRKYKEYKKEEIEEQKKNRYTKICHKMASYLSLEADQSIQKKLNPSLNLLGWELTPGMVLSGAVGVGVASIMIWAFLFLFNLLIGPIIPVSLMIIALSGPIGAGVYMFYKPVFAAKNKVIESSGEMILAILYMVVYMRSSPNLEGAIRFAALNLKGPVSKDLKGVLWDLEVGKFNTIDASLENYTENWKHFNEDFLESLNLLKAAMNESNDSRREKMLQDSIDNILDGTQEKMKHYAQGLKTPVMVINAMGAMLPVLGMIMLPLISVFMGGAITPVHLFIVFNIILPGFLWIFMQRVLSSRPPTVSSQPTENDTMPPRGKYKMEMFGEEHWVPTWPIGVLVFLIVSLWGWIGYLIFPTIYPASNIDPTSIQPGTLKAIFLASSGESLNPVLMLTRSVSIIAGAGLGIGISKYLGNISRRDAEQKIEKMESQFPNALFELGNKVSGGTPIEIGLKNAAEATEELEISELFEEAYENIEEMGMTFEEAIFDEKYGALNDYPSQMIDTIMTAALKSSKKGTKMAAETMLTISRYLKDVHKTEETLNDLMDESTTTIQLLAYMMAPVISGVAVGMSQTIITAMFKLSSSIEPPEGGGSAGGLGGSSFGGMLEGMDQAIPPELLQFVVGIYLIQLLYILGTFYMKIEHGEDVTYKNLFIGKIMISGVIFYTITLMVVSIMFGGVVSTVNV